MQGRWIVRTGQRWKENVGLVLGAIMVCGFLWFQQTGSSTPLLISFGSSFFAFYFMTLAIRCPGCGCRPMWYFARNEPISELLTSSLFQRCPRCGDEARKRNTG